MAGCLMAHKIVSVMQHSCACSECKKWKEMLCNTTKMTKRKENSKYEKRRPCFEGIRVLADHLLQMTGRSWTREHGFTKYCVNDSSRNVTRTVWWRFVFSDSETDENK